MSKLILFFPPELDDNEDVFLGKANVCLSLKEIEETKKVGAKLGLHKDMLVFCSSLHKYVLSSVILGLQADPAVNPIVHKEWPSPYSAWSINAFSGPVLHIVPSVELDPKNFYDSNYALIADVNDDMMDLINIEDEKYFYKRVVDFIYASVISHLDNGNDVVICVSRAVFAFIMMFVEEISFSDADERIPASNYLIYSYSDGEFTWEH